MKLSDWLAAELNEAPKSDMCFAQAVVPIDWEILGSGASGAESRPR